MHTNDIQRLSSKMLAGVLAVGALSALADDASLFDLRTNGMASPENVDARPSFSWKTQGGAADRRQTAVRVTVRKAGAARDAWDSGEIATDLATGLPFAGENALESATRYEWTVRTRDAKGLWTAPAAGTFTTGLLAPTDWKDSAWIFCPARGRGAGVSSFRATFKPAKAVKEAFWTVTGLGIFEAYVNGEPVASLENGVRVRDLMKPGWTEADRCRHAWTYDVTDLLKANAENVLAARVAPGWWRDEVRQRGLRGDPDCFRGVLLVRYQDGTDVRLGTDTKNWRSKYDDPVRLATIWQGEDYDARVSLAWLKDPSADAGWVAPKAFDYKGEIRPFPGSNIRLRDDLSHDPVAMYVYADVTGAQSNVCFGTVVKTRTYVKDDAVELKPGETLVVDFGQNCAAQPSFLFTGSAGTTVRVLPAEMLNDGNGAKRRGCDGPEGSVYRASFREDAKTPRIGRLNYTLAGTGEEAYRPEFSFFGYRYLSVTATDAVTIRKIRSNVVTSIPKGFETGSVVTSNPDLNRLFKNALWGQYSNYLSVPTDCPQRNERLGWTGDTQVFAPTACWNANVLPFFAKWLADVRDNQSIHGRVCAIVPSVSGFSFGPTAGWSDAAVTVPWTIYLRYGDIRILRDAWESCRKYAEEIHRTDGPVSSWLEFGDWLVEGDLRNTDKLFMRRAYQIRDFQLMKRMSKALGKEDEASVYATWEAESKAKFAKEYLQGDAVKAPERHGPQSRLALALGWDFLDGAAAKANATAAYAKSFADKGYKLATGFLGTPLVLEALAEKAGEPALAYTMLLQENCPGWLYPVKQGATTIWERWNSYTKAAGFGPVTMNSFNHYAYGAVVDWFYSGMAGIRPDEEKPGFKHFTLKPVLDPRLGSCEATFESPYGTIASRWTCDRDGNWSWRFTIPVNATATVVAPGASEGREYDPGTYDLKGTLADGEQRVVN